MMGNKILLLFLVYSCLLLDMLSDDLPSVSELQNEIAALKTQVEDQHSKVEFILKTLLQGEQFGKPCGDTQDVREEKEWN